MPLQDFSLATNFSPEGARHDKITLRIKHFIIAGEPEELSSFRNHLSVPPQGISDQATEYGIIFNRPVGNAGRAMKNTIRSSRCRGENSAPLPLFNGAYHFTPFPTMDPDATVESHLNLELHANPTRFLRYQSPHTYNPPRRTFDTHHGAQMTIGLGPDCAGEFSLDGSDNWVPSTPVFDRISIPQFWGRHLRVSIEGAMQHIQQDVSRARNALHVNVLAHEVSHSEKFNLLAVETYWDFLSDAPIQRIIDIERILHNYNELDASTRNYTNSSVGNGISVTVAIRAGVSLRVYAKTNRRIRFEVVHDLKTCCTPNRLMTFGGDRHTFPTIGGVYEKLRVIRQDAAEIMNDVFQHMRNQRSIPTVSKTALDLLHGISHMVQDAEISRVLVHILVTKGYVMSQEPFSEHLKALKRGGILETQPRNRRRAYVVTAPYRFGLEALAANCKFPHLTVRNRTRTMSGDASAP